MNRRRELLKALFWDNDGILVDTEHLYYEANRVALAMAGVDLTEAQYVDLFLVQARGGWHLAVEQGLPEADVPALRAERNRIFSHLLEVRELTIPGVENVLNAVRGQYRMGIVTSAEKDHFQLIHSRTRLLPYFEFVLAAGDYARSKPHPDPYLKALELAGCAADEALVIEDSRRGLAAAQAAGLRCVVIPSGLTRGSDFSGAYRVLSDIKELPGLLDSLL